MDLNNIAAIMVLFNCDYNDSVTLQTLNKSSAVAGFKLTVYIYNNSPTPQKEAKFSNIEIVETYHNLTNPGVSTGYNHFAHKLENRFPWLLLLDQDTAFPDDYFLELKSQIPKECALILPRLMQAATLISPHAFYLGYSRSMLPPPKGVHSLNNRSALNSGMLISTEVYLKAGGYAEDVPLYFSDQVFIQRLKNVGIKNYYLLNAECNHNMASNDSTNVTAFKKRFVLFVEGAKAAEKHFKPLTRFGLRAVVTLRGVKLSLRYKDGFYLSKSLFHQ